MKKAVLASMGAGAAIVLAPAIIRRTLWAITLSFVRSEIAIGNWMQLGLSAFTSVLIVIACGFITIFFCYGIAAYTERRNDRVSRLRYWLRAKFGISLVIVVKKKTLAERTRIGTYFSLPFISVMAEGTPVAVSLAVTHKLNKIAVICILSTVNILKHIFIGLIFQAYYHEIYPYIKPIALTVGLVTATYLVFRFIFYEEVAATVVAKPIKNLDS